MWIRALGISFLLLSASNTRAENKPLRLATADTVLTLSAGAERPSVLALASPTGATWTSPQPQELIERVRIAGEWEPVHWKLQSVSLGQGENSVTAVYRSSEPRLRLHWAWKARARSGPIEHSITIENLESHAVELPLQNSLTFDFAVPPSERLRLMWIEKGGPHLRPKEPTCSR